MKYFGYLMITLAVAVPVLAAVGTAPVPEIDASSASAAIALLSGGILVLKARNKK